MESETRDKVVETVTRILKKTDLKVATEFKIRVAAAAELGIDLSSKESRMLVRSIVESFLRSDVEENEEGKDGNVQEKPKEAVREERLPGEIKESAAPQLEAKEAIQGEGSAGQTKKEPSEIGERIVCKLSDRRNVAIHSYNGRNMVSIRDYNIKNGKEVPSTKGIDLTSEQWSILRSSLPAIEEAIRKIRKSSRLEAVDKENEGPPGPVASNSITPELVALDINRFDGKNYRAWAHQMELFLKQLNIAYVLTDPRPNINLQEDASSEGIVRAKITEQKWVNDDHICRRNILSNLSDNLFYKFSQKTSSAKEVWEQLKSVYLYEEFGTKRVQIKKYIDFQIVEDRPVTLQVIELNCLANDLAAVGVIVDEFFHVGAIMAKLPPSWKDFCMKFMHDEHVPLPVLMNHIKVEEELQRQYRSKKVEAIAEDANAPKQAIPWKRPEPEMGNSSRAVGCFVCGKKGHISRNCRSRRTCNMGGSSMKEVENRTSPEAKNG